MIEGKKNISVLLRGVNSSIRKIGSEKTYSTPLPASLKDKRETKRRRGRKACTQGVQFQQKRGRRLAPKYREDEDEEEAGEAD